MAGRIYGACLVVLLASSAFAADIKIDGETTVKEYKLVRLTVPAPDKAGVIWDVWPDGKADIEESGGKLLFTGPPGEYTVKARVITVKDGAVQIDSGKVLVVIGDAPQPPPPGPPVPTDPFLLELQAAYDQEPAASRAGDVWRLAAVYRSTAKALSPQSNQPSLIKTAGDLYFVEVNARKASIDERLPKVRAVTNAEIGKLLPGSRVGTPLDDADRALVQAKFNQLADYLEKLK